MEFKFNKDLIGTPVTPNNLEELFNVTKSDVISLTGVRGVEWEYDCEILGNYPYIDITCSSNEFILTRTINFERQMIENVQFIIYDKDNQTNGVGTLVLSSQVEYGVKFGFKKLKTNANGYPKVNDSFIGYYTWGVLGYSMIEESLEEFENVMKGYNPSIKTLFELLSTGQGRDYWKDFGGFTWEGEFLLEEDSENMRVLIEYRKQRGF